MLRLNSMSNVTDGKAVAQYLDETNREYLIEVNVKWGEAGVSVSIKPADSDNPALWWFQHA